ncbi:MAG: hypothetical protein N3A01_08090 [Bacteroidales bacterium]|nr:hypothetical protein [Bacteroidales bacterium]
MKTHKEAIVKEIRKKNRWLPIILITKIQDYERFKNLLIEKNIYIVVSCDILKAFVKRIIKGYSNEIKLKIFNILYDSISKVAGKFSNFFVAIIDSNGYILDISNTYIKFIDLEKNEIINKKFSYFFKNTTNARSLIELLKESNEINAFEFSLRSPKNTKNIFCYVDVFHLNNENIYILIIYDFPGASKEFIQQNIDVYKSVMEKVADYLHDEISPLFASVNLKIQNDCNCENKDQIIMLFNLIYKKICEIANELSIKTHVNKGLTIALIRIIEVKREYIKNIKYEINLKDKRYDENIENATYRICIELLNNSIKHSEADYIEINIVDKEDEINFTYFENGIGFDLDEKLSKATKSDKQGLINIISQINLNKGTYKFKKLNQDYFFKVNIPLLEK